MLKRSFLLLVALLISSSAFAQQTPGQTDTQLFADGVPNLAARRLSDNLGSRSNNAPVKFANASGTAIPVFNVNTNNDTVIYATSGKDVIVAVGSTPTPLTKTNTTGISLQVAGQGFNLGPAYVPTMAATPVAGTNVFAPGLNIVPTAAANTAAFLGAATPVVGQRFVINNNSGASVRIKAAGGATLNGATAGGYIVLASLATVDCFTASTGNQVCLQPVVPTPAGP